jgi:hypothetical protein
MIIEAVMRAARILQAHPGHSMSLRQLHAELVREMGAAAGTYAEIYYHLRRKSDYFAILDSPRVLSGWESWPGTVREAYDSALDEAGLGACTRVSLAEPITQDAGVELMALLSVTMGDIMALSDGNEALAAYIESATHDVAELNQILIRDAADRPTIPLPDPPPPA